MVTFRNIQKSRNKGLRKFATSPLFMPSTEVEGSYCKFKKFNETITSRDQTPRTQRTYTWQANVWQENTLKLHGHGWLEWLDSLHSSHYERGVWSPKWSIKKQPTNKRPCMRSNRRTGLVEPVSVVRYLPPMWLTSQCSDLVLHERQEL